ncbi:hypothetical protein EV191_12445 [Tamaricihabitans halophyticus]|uniref:Terpene synthase n=1 Tax=Tamaricihabitans halophyticus TaxID=1262583 RepID=A0A4R2Q139_9PSEU|nr:terpene synthase family protein [Tamaricihabitans halophyticus]TCP42079.1 hypothetical protein EV191_12445 [Tamaricihabitans halophyticus]
MELAADIFVWLLAVDDLIVEAPETTPADLAAEIASFVSVLATGSRSASTGFVKALGELAVRMRDVLTPEQSGRVRATLHELFLAWLWEATASTGPISLDEYTTMRPHTAFGYMVVTLMEPGNGLDLPAALLDQSEIRDLNRHLARLSGWTNDLISFGYEQQQFAGVPQTLPLILARERRRHVSEALVEAAHLRDTEAEAACRLIARLATSTVPQAAAYAAAARIAIASAEHQYTGAAQRYGTPPR